MASKLFSPITLRGVTFKNRIFVPPMCQYSCQDGVPGPWHMVHLGSRAVGGAACIIQEATAVVPEGRISPGDAGLWNDAQVEAFRPIVQFIKDAGAVPCIQIAHAGRKGSVAPPWEGGKSVASDKGGWTPVAPSALPFDAQSSTPTALSEADIAEVVQAFAKAAERSLATGYEAVELHAAHGYLMHEFLSPLTNKRSDRYGGSLENRMRIVLEVASAVRKVWPERLPLFARLSATDWVAGGWDLPQSIRLCAALKDLGVDFIDVSTAGLVPDAKVPAGPGYQVPFAAAIKREVGLPVGAVGLITDAPQAEQVIVTEQADVVLLGRETLRNPYWPLYAAKELGADIAWPRQYERARI